MGKPRPIRHRAAHALQGMWHADEAEEKMLKERGLVYVRYRDHKVPDRRALGKGGRAVLQTSRWNELWSEDEW